MKLKDINVNVPAEYLEYFIQIMETGIERTKIPSKIRKELKEWWEVERCYLRPE